MLLYIFNKKYQQLKVCSITFFLYLFQFFNNILNYFCNFFLSISGFFFELFFNTGFIYDNKINKSVIKIIKLYFYFNYFKINKFCNNVFNSIVNNYYASDFYIKNSKIMSFGSLNQFKIFKL